MNTTHISILTVGVAITQLSSAQAADHLVFEANGDSKANGKHIVLMAGDEEYRSEESMPMMAQILASQGFKCTVLFSMDKDNQFVDPLNQKSLSNSVALDSADAIIMAIRFRNYPENDMAKFVAAFERGTPIVALRTSTHAFQIPQDSKYHKYHWGASPKTGWQGGFGRQVLGETWVNHHGAHNKQGTLTIVEEANKKHPVLNGVEPIFGKTDVYGANPIQPSTILLRGAVTESLKRDSKPIAGKKNQPMMPVAWVREFKHDNGKVNKILTTTMGSSDDLSDENLRRLVINGVYWGLDLYVPAKADATLKSTFEPTYYSYGGFKKKQRVSDFVNVRPTPKKQVKVPDLKSIKGKPGNVRYVRVELPGVNKTLTLAEVEVISENQNVALKGKATQSTTAWGGLANKAIDGNPSGLWEDGSQSHTADAKVNPWWELDLGASYDVSKVRVWNRVGGFKERLSGVKVVLLDSNRKQLFATKPLAAPNDSLSINLKKNGKVTYPKGQGAKPAVPVVIKKIDGPKLPAVVKGKAPKALQIGKNSRIGFVGGGLGSRMNLFNEFETELQRRYPKNDLYIRNFCHEGDTPAFRPHPSRRSPWVLDSLADKGRSLMKKEYQSGGGNGHYETPDQWLTRHGIDTVIGFFGYSESFDGATKEDLDRYKNELRAFITHSLKAKYTNNGTQLAIVSPAAFENLSQKLDLPSGEEINQRLQAYTKAMQEVCAEEGILFVDVFSITKGFYKKSSGALTSNGHNLTAKGYKALSPVLADSLFGKAKAKSNYAKVKSAVSAKNKLWVNDYKVPNGVHVHGRRYKPYGNDNYPGEIKKTREMTKIRDRAIWAANKGIAFNPVAEDAKTHKLKEIKTNSNRPVEYKTGKEVADMLEMAPGFKVELFADEKMFPELQNPSQMAFDNQGRLWVGCMGSYPHWKIGDSLPNDKIIILEDTNNDGKADKLTNFVENIHIPMGFEITEHGVFVSLGKNLVLFKDTNGDGKADKREIVLSGFDDHDTHHAISSFCADPSGAIYMGEGTFSHSNVETPYGPVRGTNGGFYRYNPTKMRLERTTQLGIPNPWGIAFNEWGQNFFLHTSGPAFSWMQQAAVKPRYNVNLGAPNLLSAHNVRPTSGVEFVSSRHFPEEQQGDLILCNNIGFLGAKQHKMEDDPSTGFFKTSFRQNLFVSPKEYQYFRPVDLEFAPDGSLYFIDWSNVLVGHMQHNARDPKRDHVHGRVYRVTYPSRPLVKPAKIAGAPISTLLENLKLPEYRSRYRTRRELRGRNANEVASTLRKWVAKLDKNDAKYQHHQLEALWVSWGINKIDQDILEAVLKSDDYRARTAAVRAVRYNADKLDLTSEYLLTAAEDKHPQVRHEAVIAASWLGRDIGLPIVEAAKKQPISSWSKQAFQHAEANLKGEKAKEEKKVIPLPKHIAASKDKELKDLYEFGHKVYHHGESCVICHQPNGQGVPNAFPPLDGSKWVTSEKDLLGKIVLHGIQGPMEVKGKSYNGLMQGFLHRFETKQEAAAVMTFVRNTWGNKTGDKVTAKEVEAMMQNTKGQTEAYQASDLLKNHKLK